MLKIGARFQYHPPWAIADFGCSFWPLHRLFNLFRDRPSGPLPLAFRGGDEWGNRSVALVVPLVGMVVWFTGSNAWGGRFRRDGWFHSGYVDGQSHWVSPDYQFEAWLPGPDDLPLDSDDVDETEPEFVDIAPQPGAFITEHALAIGRVE